MFLCSLVLGLMVSPGAMAQIKDPQNRTLRPADERVPEELRAQGLVYKGFVYNPSVVVETRYDSNILSQNDDERSDYIVSIRPKLQVGKDYDGHRFSLEASGNISRFAKRPEENSEEFSLSGGALINANSKWSFPLEIERSRTKRARNAPTPNALTRKPLNIDKFKGSIGVTRNFNRLSLTLQGEYQDVEFQDGVLNGGNDVAVFSDDNREVYGGELNLKYEIPRGRNSADIEHSLFTTLAYSHQDNDTNSFVSGSFSGPSGDRDIAGLIAGFQTSYKGLLFARLGAGFIHQDFKESSLESTFDIDFLADIEYQIRPKISLYLQAEREIDQDNGFVSGVENSRFLLGTNYEIHHDLYLKAETEYKNFDFKNANREDDDFTGRIGLRYLNSRNIKSELDVSYTQRDSTVPVNEFDRFIFLLRLTGEI